MNTSRNWKYVVNSDLECLHCPDVNSVTKVLEVQAASIFRIGVCYVGEFMCIHIGLKRHDENKGVGKRLFQ
jgi:hypothetical protein